MPYNLFALADSSFKAGSDLVNDYRKQRADTQAAPMIARGDFKGAAGVYGYSGLAGDAMDAQKAQQDVDQTAYQHGRDDVADKRQKTEDEIKRGELMYKGLSGLGGYATPAERRQAIKTSPIFQALGLDKVADQMTDADLSTDVIEGMKGQVKQHIQVLHGAGGSVFSYDDRDPEKTFKTLRESDKPTILKQGDTLLGEDNRPVYTAPKTFAPRAPAKPAAGDDNSAALQAIEAELRRRGKL